MREIDISIVVPVYNVKDYLERCMKSLISQTYEKYEIILIDDGSTDGSGELCNKYANISNVTVIHQSNGGLSAARNTGVKASNGKYIMFVDSDDYIDETSCERFMREVYKHEYDIICADAYRATDNGITEKNKDRKSIKTPCTGLDFLVESVSQKSMCMCAPFAIYRRELIVKNELWFQVGLLHEDELWTPQMYLLANEVSYIPFRFYYHWERKGSISQSMWTSKRENDMRYICFTLDDIYNKKILDNQKKKVLKDRLCMLYLNSLNLSKNKKGDKPFLRNTAYSMRNRLKALLYIISPELYFKINPHKST